MLRKKTTKLHSKPLRKVDTNRRRSLSNVPSKKPPRVPIRNPSTLRIDRMSNVPIIPTPSDRKSKQPSLKKFVAGRSSLWSIASAVSKLEQSRRDTTAKMSQSFPGAWFMNDKKQLLEEMNEGSRMGKANFFTQFYFFYVTNNLELIFFHSFF